MECSNCLAKTRTTVCPQCYKDAEDWNDYYIKQVEKLQWKLSKNRAQVKDLKAQIKSLRHTFVEEYCEQH